jgi:hypothetical protein
MACVAASVLSVLISVVMATQTVCEIISKLSIIGKVVMRVAVPPEQSSHRKIKE